MRDTKTEHWLDTRNVPWKYHPAVPLGSFDLVGSLTGQTRLWANQIREDHVTRLALVIELALARSDPAPLPAPICWQRVNMREHPWMISDGHHRLEAYKMVYASRPSVGAKGFTANAWEDATIDVYELLTSSSTVIEIITRTANIALNGIPCDSGEDIDQAIALVDNCGLTIRQAASYCLIKEDALAKHLRTREVSRSLASQGMKHKDEQLGMGMMLLLHTIKLDIVRTHMAAAIIKYRPTLQMAKDVIDEVNGRATEKEIIRSIDNVCRRSDWEERLTGCADNGKRPRRPPRELMFGALRGLIRVISPHRSLYEMQVRSDRDHKELGRLWGGAKSMMTELLNRAKEDAKGKGTWNAVGGENGGEGTPRCGVGVAARSSGRSSKKSSRSRDRAPA